MFRLLLVAVLAALLPAMTRSEPRQEMQENAFLDLVEVEGHVLVQGSGVEAVNTKARRQGLSFPALGYWSPEGHCFVKPAPGECNGMFRRGD